MMKRMFWTLFVVMIGLTLISFDGQYSHAKDEGIHVYFEGERLIFEDTDPIITNGRTLVPFRKIFETLGFEVEWIDGKTRKAIGKKAGLTIELTIDSNKAKVNGKTIEMDVPAQILKSRTLVPLRFVSENSGYHVYYAKEDGLSIIGIGTTEELANPGVIKQPATPVPSSGDIEPYIVKGRIVNSQGQPLPRAEVFADNTYLYNSNILGVTDESGYYRLELPEVITSYRMGARYKTVYQNKEYNFDIYPEPNHPFAGSTGAIRDFVLDLSTGTYESTGAVDLYSWDLSYPEDENAPTFELDHIELTLKPIGKLIDGSTGNTIIGFPAYGDGVQLKGIPIGSYELTAIWKPKGYKPVPMRVSIRNTDQYEESITFTIEANYAGHYITQIEVQFP